MAPMLGSFGASSVKVFKGLQNKGIGRAIVATGGVVTEALINSQNYRIHTFDSPGESLLMVEDAPDDGILIVEMWGSGGSNEKSGAGGYSYGEVNTFPNDQITIEVGDATISNLGRPNDPKGGKRSAIWRTSNTDEILVAGGGGAAKTQLGGAGGGLSGQDSQAGYSSPNPYNFNKFQGSAGGGTQSSGGTAGSGDGWSGHISTGQPGTRINPGRGVSSTSQQGGVGGSGYYGGGSAGASAYNGGGGGGGSGYIDSSVLNGITEAGDRDIPGNPSNPLRGVAGEPGENAKGIVIIRYPI